MTEMSEARLLAEDATDKLLQGSVDKALVDAAEEGAWPEALWSELHAAGLTLAAVPEAAGGAGLEAADALALLRLIGGHAAPVPLGEQMIATRVLAEAGLTAMPEGVLSVALPAGDEPLSFADGKLDGETPVVPWGRQATRLVVPVVGGLALVSPDAGECTPGVSMAGEPRDSFRFAGAPAQFVAANISVDRLRTELALTRVQLMTGALESVLEQSVAYAMEREQFGRPISKFQAVQHLLAELAGEVAAAIQAAEAGLRAMDTDAFAVQVAAAKARVGEAVGRSTEIAHQVHGAMGFTHEHHLHHRTRRLWSWRDEFGDEGFWQMRLGAAVMAAGADDAWAFITRH